MRDVMPDIRQLIAARLSDPGAYPQCKLAVVANVGGQRWVIPGGMVARLEAAGLYADIIGGASGGGLSAVFYAARQAYLGGLVLRHLNNMGFNRDGKLPKFITRRKLLIGKPPMDIHMLVNDIFIQRAQLDLCALQQAGRPVFTIATSREGQKVVQRLDGAAVEDIPKMLTNTARIPALAHPTRDLNVLWDGGLSEPFPVQTALDLGATHVLALSCFSLGEQLRIPLSAQAIRLQSPAFYRMFVQGKDAHVATLNSLRAPNRNMLTLALPSTDIHSAEMDEGKLLCAGVAGWRRVEQVLGWEALPPPAEWATPL